MPVRIRSSIAANSGPRWLIIWRAPASRTRRRQPGRSGDAQVGLEAVHGNISWRSGGDGWSGRSPLVQAGTAPMLPQAHPIMSRRAFCDVPVAPSPGTPVRPLSGRVMSSADGPGPHRRSLPVARATRERGMATVWRARDEWTREIVAVKRLHPYVVADPAARAGWNAKRPPCARWTTRRSSGRASWWRTPTRRRWSWTSSRAGRSTNGSPVVRCRRAKPSRSPASSRTRSRSRTTTGSSTATSSPATSWSTMTERCT